MATPGPSHSKPKPLQRVPLERVIEEILHDSDSGEENLYDSGDDGWDEEESDTNAMHPLIVQNILAEEESSEEGSSTDEDSSDEGDRPAPKRSRGDPGTVSAPLPSTSRADSPVGGRARGIAGRQRGRGRGRGRGRQGRRQTAPLIENWENAIRDDPNQDIPFTGSPGIQFDATGFEPKDFMELFFSDDLFNCLVTETNRYAEQYFDAHPDLPQYARSRDWKKVDVPEMKKFLGMIIHMGLVKLPAIDLYWSKMTLYNTNLFNVVMSRNRFQAILKFLHFHDNNTMPQAGDPNYDRLYKIRPIVDHLHEKFQEVYTPRREVCVDESLLLWKGRLIFRQYIPLKRARFGIKIYLCCESDGDVRGSGGYCYRFKIYAGKEDPVTEVRNVLPADAQHLSTSEQMVVFLIVTLLGQGYVVYTDNWYTSLRLATYLLSKQTLACGTIRANRGVPELLQAVQLQPGASSAMLGDNRVVATKYHSTKVVHLLSTAHGHRDQPIADRRRRGINRRPVVSADYNRNMGGVDKQDQLITPYDCTRKTMKWTKKLFFHLMQVAACNGYILAKKEGYQGRFLQFLESLTLSWTRPDVTVEGVAAEPGQTDDDVRLSGHHYCDYIPPTPKKVNPQRECRVCRKTGVGRRDTRFYCPQCPSNPGLCFPHCFKLYHTRLVYWQ